MPEISSSQASRVSDASDEPVYTASTVSKLAPRVLTVTWLFWVTVIEYQVVAPKDWPSQSPSPSPTWVVAPTLSWVTPAPAPIAQAAAKLSFVGAAGGRRA